MESTRCRALVLGATVALGALTLLALAAHSPRSALGERESSAPSTVKRKPRSVDSPCTPLGEGTCRRLPKALIIGVKKGGTRALLEFIRLHPDIRAVGPETHFFDRHYQRGLEWYRSRMPQSNPGQLTMEKTPSYFVTRAAPARIRRMSRDIKLLVVLRDPVTRALSDYAQTASKRPEVKSFEQLAFANMSTGLVDTSWSAIRIGTYCHYLSRWQKYFPPSQIHFVDGGVLVSSPEVEMAKVERFLGLEPFINASHFFFNETKRFPCVWRTNKKPTHGPHCLGKSKGRSHPNVNPSTLQILKDFYKPFNAKLYQMTGINFNWS
uniref:Sulfotransferase domain-containing protein n=1 Tax=Strigamia maritima TaxID=126957 RepID=T1JBT2_STRMM